MTFVILLLLIVALGCPSVPSTSAVVDYFTVVLYWKARLTKMKHVKVYLTHGPIQAPSSCIQKVDRTEAEESAILAQLLAICLRSNPCYWCSAPSSSDRVKVTLGKVTLDDNDFQKKVVLGRM